MDQIRDRINEVALKVAATDRGIVRLGELLSCFKQSESERAARVRNLLAPFSSASAGASASAQDAQAQVQLRTRREREDDEFSGWLLGVETSAEREHVLPDTLGEDEESAIESLEFIHPELRFRLYLTWVYTSIQYSTILCCAVL